MLIGLFEGKSFYGAYFNTFLARAAYQVVFLSIKSDNCFKTSFGKGKNRVIILITYIYTPAT